MVSAHLFLKMLEKMSILSYLFCCLSMAFEAKTQEDLAFGGTFFVAKIAVKHYLIFVLFKLCEKLRIVTKRLKHKRIWLFSGYLFVDQKLIKSHFRSSGPARPPFLCQK